MKEHIKRDMINEIHNELAAIWHSSRVTGVLTRVITKYLDKAKLVSTELVCDVCGGDLDCYSGMSAHRDNWYCPKCRDTDSTVDPDPVNATDAMKGTARRCMEPIEHSSSSVTHKVGNAKEAWGLDAIKPHHYATLEEKLAAAKPGEAIPVTKEEMERFNKMSRASVVDDTLFEEWGAYELPEHTIEAFLASEAAPEAVISFTKKELEDWRREIIKKISKSLYIQTC